MGGSRPERASGSKTTGARPRLLVAAGLVWLGGPQLLVQRRPVSASHGAGMLELPGGKVEAGESPRAALIRELAEEWGPRSSELRLGRVAEVLHHLYAAPGLEVDLVIFHVDGSDWARGEWRDRVVVESGAQVSSFGLAGLPLDQFLAADRDFLRELQRGGDGWAPC